MKIARQERREEASYILDQYFYPQARAGQRTHRRIHSSQLDAQAAGSGVACVQRVRIKAVPCRAAETGQLQPAMLDRCAVRESFESYCRGKTTRGLDVEVYCGGRKAGESEKVRARVRAGGMRVNFARDRTEKVRDF